MTMKDYAAVLRRGWLCLVAGLLLGIGAALLANTLLPREYRSDLTIYCVGQADGDYSVAAAEVALSRMPSYQRLLMENRVLEDVVWRLDLPETPPELAQRIAVTNDPETLLLKI